MSKEGVNISCSKACNSPNTNVNTLLRYEEDEGNEYNLVVKLQ